MLKKQGRTICTTHLMVIKFMTIFCHVIDPVPPVRGVGERERKGRSTPDISNPKLLKFLFYFFEPLQSSSPRSAVTLRDRRRIFRRFFTAATNQTAGDQRSDESRE